MKLEEFLDFEVNGMEAPRYLAAALLCASSYTGTKYYEAEDRYTERIIDFIKLLIRRQDTDNVEGIINSSLKAPMLERIKGNHWSDHFNRDCDIIEHTLQEIVNLYSL